MIAPEAIFALFLAILPAFAQLKPNNFFTVGHPPLIRTRLDPIVNPGAVAPHVHLVSGSNAFSEDMDFAKAVSGDCTTSMIQADMSGYWAPQLYYKYKNGTYYPIQGDGIVTYWKFSFNDPSEKFAVVPDDFRMLGDNITRDFFDKSIPSHDAVSFECFGNGYDERLSWIPTDRECETIRPQVYFPSCWNGKDAFLPDNSHVTYPLERFEGGPCPDGFVRIPNLFLEAYYKPKLNVPDYEWYPGCLVFSNGDNNGFSFHADWRRALTSGWPSGMLVEASEKCQMSANIDGCAILEASVDYKKRDACVSKGTVVAEPVGMNAPLAQLPGNNPEYNSSRTSPDHKKELRMGYTESAKIVPIPADGSGSCVFNVWRWCLDYMVNGGSTSNGSPPMDNGTMESRTVDTKTMMTNNMSTGTMVESETMMTDSMATNTMMTDAMTINTMATETMMNEPMQTDTTDTKEAETVWTEIVLGTETIRTQLLPTGAAVTTALGQNLVAAPSEATGDDMVPTVTKNVCVTKRARSRVERAAAADRPL